MRETNEHGYGNAVVQQEISRPRRRLAVWGPGFRQSVKHRQRRRATVAVRPKGMVKQ